MGLCGNFSNVFEEAAQLSVIVYDNRLNNSNDEAISINIL